MEREPEPRIGDGCTIHIGSDSHAATIIHVQTTSKGELVILTQEDKATQINIDPANPYSESQQYSYQPNPKGTRRFFRKDLIGGRVRWREVHCTPSTQRFKLAHASWSPGLTIGVRESHHDHSF